MCVCVMCMFVCVYVCVCVSVYICVLCVFVRMCVHACVYVHVCMSVCVCVCVLCLCVCVCVCLCVCVRYALVGKDFSVVESKQKFAEFNWLDVNSTFLLFVVGAIILCNVTIQLAKQLAKQFVTNEYMHHHYM